MENIKLGGANGSNAMSKLNPNCCVSTYTLLYTLNLILKNNLHDVYNMLHLFILLIVKDLYT